MASSKVQKKDEDRLSFKINGDENTYLKPSIKRGSMVRISKKKNVFVKATCQTNRKSALLQIKFWSCKEEQSVGYKRLKTTKIRLLKDHSTLKKFKKITANEYLIKLVLRHKTVPYKTNDLFVKQKCMPGKFNSWNQETDKYNVAE